MTVMWKFPLALGDVVTLEMPMGAEPLYVAMQGGVPCLWARVNPMLPKEMRRFRFAGTGHTLHDDVGRYIGSWQMADGALVFHLFEMGR